MAQTEIVKKDPKHLAELATQINAEHQACEDGVRDGVCHALEAGRLLTEAKGGMKHGEWLPWLSGHFKGTNRIAARYMKTNSIVVALEMEKNCNYMSLYDVLRLMSPKCALKKGVYFAEASGLALIKIGHSLNADRRLRDLQAGSPATLRLLGVVPGKVTLERQLHAQFAADRVCGEWFNASVELTQYIANHCTKGGSSGE